MRPCAFPGRRLTLFLVLAGLWLVALPGHALAAVKSGDLPAEFRFELARLPEAGPDRPGLVLALTLTPAKGWYTYANEPGSPLAKPTRISATIAPGSEPLAVLHPPGAAKPDAFEPGLTIMAYQGPTTFFVPIPAGTRRPFTLTAAVEMLLCTATKCLPVRQDLSYKSPGPEADLPRAEQAAWWPSFTALSAKARPAPAAPAAARPAPPPDDSFAALARAWVFTPVYLHPGLEVSNLVMAVLFGLLAGFILNFMPCVLPVVSLKLSALLSGGTGAGGRPREELFREHNLFFAFGILLYFLLLSLLFALTDLAWGQMFQRREVVAILAALVFVLGLSLMGLYSLPIVDLKFGVSERHPRLQALLTGMLATLLATPCSGPFLGGVLGWTLVQPAEIMAAVFAAIGTGMAAPYIVMTVSPRLVRFLPRPGPWTVHLERVVAFLLLGTCIYLLNILPQDYLIPTLVLLWITALSAWVWDIGYKSDTRRRKVLLQCLGVVMFWVAALWAVQPKAESPWQRFEAEAFTARLGTAAMVVDFTADWCPTCKVLERTVLTPGTLADLKERYGVEFVRVDLTEPRPEAEELLRALGSQSIPLLAVFGTKDPGSPLVLRDLFTAGQLDQAVRATVNR